MVVCSKAFHFISFYLGYYWITIILFIHCVCIWINERMFIWQCYILYYVIHFKQRSHYNVLFSNRISFTNIYSLMYIHLSFTFVINNWCILLHNLPTLFHHFFSPFHHFNCIQHIVIIYSAYCLSIQWIFFSLSLHNHFFLFYLLNNLFVCSFLSPWLILFQFLSSQKTTLN